MTPELIQNADLDVVSRSSPYRSRSKSQKHSGFPDKNKSGPVNNMGKYVGEMSIVDATLALKAKLLN